MAENIISVTLPKSVLDSYDNFERTPTVTAAVNCMICDTPIPIYDYYVAPPVAICGECKKRLKDLLYKQSGDE